jgi:hypothetical protein
MEEGTVMVLAIFMGLIDFIMKNLMDLEKTITLS